MIDLPDDKRRFSEEEVAFIIRRASELQESEEIRQIEETSGTALTLRDVEQIARDADIDPRLVSRAAQELSRRGVHELGSGRDKSLLDSITGSPSRLTVERVVSGEISSDVYADLVNEMRRMFNDEGLSSSLGHTFEWASSRSPGLGISPTHRQIKARITSREGVTTIHLEEDLRSAILALFVGVTVYSGAGMMALTAGAFGLPVVRSMAVGVSWLVAAVGASYMLARKISASLSSSRQKQLEELMARLERIVSRCATPSALPPPAD